MDEMNTLISPYKKLKVGPAENKDSSMVGSPVEMHADVMKTDKNTVSETEQNVNKVVVDSNLESYSADQGYVDSATAMLLDEKDCEKNSEEITGSSEVLDTAVPQNCLNAHLSLTLSLHAEDKSLGNNDHTMDFTFPAESATDISEDLRQTLKVVNACKQEIANLIENRKTEVEAICNGVNVGAIIKQLENRNDQKSTQDCVGVTEELQKPDLHLDLDESITSESTDELNSSSKTVVDLSVQDTNQLENTMKLDQDTNPLKSTIKIDQDTNPVESTMKLDQGTNMLENTMKLDQDTHMLESTIKIDQGTIPVESIKKIEGEQDLHINDAFKVGLCSEDCIDHKTNEDCENQLGHYHHVYANVVINECTESDRNMQLPEQGCFTQVKYTDGMQSRSDEDNVDYKIPEKHVNPDNKSKRTDGDGKEVDETVHNYFCSVEADDADEVEKCENECLKDTEYFDRENAGAEPFNSYIETLTTSRMVYPLCASTPVRQTGAHRLEMENTNDKHLYNFQNTLVDSQDTNLADKQRNSEPLCASTPLVKPAQGLRVRDMNIMNEEEDKKAIKCIEKIETDENAYVNNIVGSENDVLARRNERNIMKEKQGLEGTLKRDRESRREKKKMKGVRKEKFKEYMGPGLTSGLNSEGNSEVMVGSSQNNVIRDSDIETCTLVEYKGFGLTGPLPDRPLQSSTPLPPMEEGANKHVHFENTCKNFDGKNSLRRCISGSSLGGRPAGTEGMLIDGLSAISKQDNITQYNMQSCFSKGQKLRQAVSESKFGQRTNLVAKLNTKTLTRHTSDLGPSGYTRQNRLTGWLEQVQAHKTQLPTLSETSQPTTAVTLRSDQAYPSVTSVKVEKSESNSNADKSDKSEKIAIDPKLLQTTGQLKVSAYMNFGLLTVHVIQGRQLSAKWKNSCDSFVKLSLIPDDGKKPKCKTEVVQDTNNPLYDEKFSFELDEEDHNKRLMISVWHRDISAGVNEFLGCMSFGIRHLTNPRKEVNGWYYLLTEEIGRKKHLQVSHRQHPQLKIRNQSHIPSVNKDVWGTESLTLTLHRGKTGFGFSVIEACPVRVGRVDGSSPAEAAGLQPGDIIIRLNKQNVSRSTATSVAKLIKHSSNTMILELHRPRPVTYEQLENSPLKPSTNHGTNTDRYDNDITISDYPDQSVPQMYTLNDDENKENEGSIEDQTIYPINPHIASLATSTPLPLLARGHRTVQTCEVRKQEAIHRLLSLELDFIDLMHSGMQRYSRPLRHCILSHSHHATLFQNIEKLVTISEYHVKQMHDNAPSSFISEDDTDTSGSSDNHNFIQSIGLIYQSKVHMLCQAYELYAKGISAANQLLSELRRHEDFVRFVRDPPLEGNQPSISAFVYRPVQHIRDLYKVVQEVFSNTPTDSPDYHCLKEVVAGLQECSTNITNYSCERVESLTSLTSGDSKASFTCSMKSKSSSTSCSSASSKGQGHMLQTSKAVDHQVMKIQDRLVFPSNVPVFQLCQDDRHLVFSGDMFKWEGHQWMKIHVYLFTDLILETVRESDGYLRVIQEPTMLRDIAAMDAQRSHATEFVLYCSSRLSGKRKLNFRAPSTEQKMAWKSLIEQRVFTVRGSMDYYSSTSDVSSSSASAIVI